MLILAVCFADENLTTHYDLLNSLNMRSLKCVFVYIFVLSYLKIIYFVSASIFIFTPEFQTNSGIKPYSRLLALVST